MNKLVQRDKAKEEVKIIPLFVGGQNMFLRIYLIFGLPILLLDARSPPRESGRNPDDPGRSPRGPEKKPGDSGNSPNGSGESRGEYTVCSIQVNTTPAFYKNSGVLLKFSPR